MAEKKILVPYNFTTTEEKALAFVIDTFSNRNDVKITLFNTYTPLPVVDMGASPEMQKMRDAMNAISKDIEEARNIAQQHPGIVAKLAAMMREAHVDP